MKRNTRRLRTTCMAVATVGFGARAIGYGDLACGWGPLDEAKRADCAR